MARSGQVASVESTSNSVPKLKPRREGGDCRLTRLMHLLRVISAQPHNQPAAQLAMLVTVQLDVPV